MRNLRTSVLLLVLGGAGSLCSSAEPPPSSTPHSSVQTVGTAQRTQDPPSAVSLHSAAEASRELRKAISRNDLERFRSLLVASRAFADSMPIGSERNALRQILLVASDLETVWSFASADVSGSFYDDQSLAGFHDHLTTDYSDYSSFIDAFRVIDRSGRILYPTAETRSFLAGKLSKLTLPAASGAAPRQASVTTRPSSKRGISSTSRDATSPAARAGNGKSSKKQASRPAAGHQPQRAKSSRIGKPPKPLPRRAAAPKH